MAPYVPCPQILKMWHRSRNVRASIVTPPPSSAPRHMVREQPAVKKVYGVHEQHTSIELCPHLGQGIH